MDGEMKLENNDQTDEIQACHNGHSGGDDPPVDGAVETGGAETAVEAAADAAELPTDSETIARLERELAEAQAKTAEVIDQMQRAAAEFQNARRRQQRQLDEQILRAGHDLIARILPILDDFNLAYANVPADLQGESAAWTEGFRHIQKKLEDILRDAGLQPIDTSGEFDPHRHEAISHEPSSEIESGHIIQTLRTGYQLKDRVLRPALVRVAQ